MASHLAKDIAHDVGEVLTRKYGDFRPQQQRAVAEYFSLIQGTVEDCLERHGVTDEAFEALKRAVYVYRNGTEADMDAEIDACEALIAKATRK